MNSTFSGMTYDAAVIVSSSPFPSSLGFDDESSSSTDPTLSDFSKGLVLMWSGGLGSFRRFFLRPPTAVPNDGVEVSFRRYNLAIANGIMTVARDVTADAVEVTDLEEVPLL